MLLLFAAGCGPDAPDVDHRGECGAWCKPDGSCVSERLVCTPGKLYLGIPMNQPVCLPKVSP